MKRALPLCLALALVLVLTACGSNAGQSGTGSDSAPGVDAPVSAAPETSPVNQPNEPDAGGRNTLIAYFSATNNTENIANHLESILDADLYEIVPETPYTSDDLNYSDSSSRTSQEMGDPDARPAVSGTVENMEQYEVIFLGYPIWWGEAPRIINTFLESYDLDGKTIVPFCTSGSSPIGSSAANLQDLTGTAQWLEGQRFSGGASAADVQSWVDSLNLNG